MSESSRSPMAEVQPLLLQIVAEQRTSSATLSAILVRLDTLDELYQVVIRGDRQPSLVEQLIKLNGWVVQLQTWRETMEAQLLSMRLERRRSATALAVAMISGVLAIAGIVLGRLLK